MYHIYRSDIAFLIGILEKIIPIGDIHRYHRCLVIEGDRAGIIDKECPGAAGC
jgi:hypothetical protein